MDFKVLCENYYETAADTLVVPVYENETPKEGFLKELDERVDGTIASIFERREFRGKANELAYIHHSPGLKARRLLLVGIGKEEKANDWYD